jgi:hypothetical protein
MQRKLAAVAELPYEGSAAASAGRREGRRLPVPGLSGRSIMCIVDDRSLRSEGLLLRRTIFPAVGASEASVIMPYSQFYQSDSLPPADVLLLRSSRIFRHRLRELTQNLGSFRRANPRSAVLLCVFDDHEADSVAGLSKSGVVNAVYTDPPDDLGLLRKAADVLERLVSGSRA